MRSRYSAFAKQKIDYIVQTTALGQQQALDVAAIQSGVEATNG
jgi:SEC-C motif-containing protein